ncbi:MAG: hypothetical protein ACREDR_00800, partial [Blastocatellia bacterium]
NWRANPVSPLEKKRGGSQRDERISRDWVRMENSEEGIFSMVRAYSARPTRRTKRVAARGRAYERKVGKSPAGKAGNLPPVS